MSTLMKPKSRIPSALQAVFLTSNRGAEVIVAPPDRVASRMFRTWFSTKDGTKKEVLLAPLEVSTAVVVSQPTVDPQHFFETMMNSRGYSATSYSSIRSAYYNRPTQLQQASYDLFLVDVAKSGQTEKLKDMINAGLSPNPSNTFGESLLHMICRRGWAEVLTFLVHELHLDVQIADDHGRTPMHDACWAPEPNFQVVKVLLDCDPHLLFMADVRGSLPLSYVHKKHWAAWVQFLDAEKDTYWPKHANGMLEPPPLTLKRCNSRPMPDPENACSLELAKMVASGRMKPYEVILLQLSEQKGSNNSSSVVDETEVDSDSEEDYTDSDEDYTDSSCDSLESDLSLFENYEQEMAGLLKGFSIQK